MKNIYSCGCHAEGDIPILSRCKDHNGYIVAATEHARTREVFNKSRLTVWHDTLENNLSRLPDAAFEHIFSYPEHDLFYAQSFMTRKAWRDSPMGLFAHIKRLLKPEGYATLVVDYGALHTVLYQAGLADLDFKVGRTLFKEFIPEPLYGKAYEFTDAKVIVDLFVGSRKLLPETGAKVLDLSSILLDRTMRRSKQNKVLAFCNCPNRFKLIKKTLS